MSLIWWWWHWGVQVDWGNVPAYFSGGALLYAALTYRSSVKTKVAEQAGKISVWVDWNGQPPPGGDWKVWVKNASETSVSDVAVGIVQEAGLKKGRRSDDWLGEPQGKTCEHVSKYPFLGPGAERVIFESIKGAPVTAVSLSFRDSAGRTWKQSIEGGRYTKPEQVK